MTARHDVEQALRLLKVRPPRVNAAEEAFLFQWRTLCLRHDAPWRIGPNAMDGGYGPLRNYRFHNARRWEIDFAWPDFLVGLEIQGGIWIAGAHARPVNIERDMEKHNALLDLGWRVWHFTPKQVKAGYAVQHLERVLLSVRKGESCVDQRQTSKPPAESSPGSSGDLLDGYSSSQPPF